MGEVRWASLVVVWWMVGVLALGAPPPRDPRPRSIRGFKNVALSTARGFGKRSSDSLQQPPTLLPAEWFANEMLANPDLARVVVTKFIDTDGDGLLSSAELLRPLGYHQEYD